MNAEKLTNRKFLYGMSLDEYMAYAHIPGLSAAWRDGEGEHVFQRGVKRAREFAHESAGVESSTLFQAGSISKAVFAYLVMRLHSLNKLDIYEDISPLFTRFGISAPVTFHSLLSHTAGINVHGFDGYVPGNEPSLDDVIEGRGNSAKIVRDLENGRYFRYSGGGYTLAQYALISLTGREVNELAHEYVFGPLSMASSGYLQPLPASYIPRAATGHPSDSVPLAHMFMAHPELAAAGLWSTPADLLKFANELHLSYNGRGILPMECARIMTAPVADRMCVGLFTDRDGAIRYHGGSNIGYESYFGFSLKDELAFAFMTNANGGRALCTALADALIDG